MDWKTFVETDQAKTYVLPRGWDTRAYIAEQMSCSEARVRLFLSAAVRRGDLQMEVHPVWDEKLKRVIRITAYRKTPRTAPKVDVEFEKDLARARRMHRRRPRPVTA
jgi:hypothetical protein